MALNGFEQTESAAASADGGGETVCSEWLAPTAAASDDDESVQLKAISVNYDAYLKGMTLHLSDGSST